MKQLTERQVAAIFGLSPFELTSFNNALRQRVRLLEHPTLGDESPVLVHIEENGVNYMCVSDFYEIDDMSEILDYQPLLVDGRIVHYFELEEPNLIALKLNAI
ncbi:MAG: hypothetical protein M5Z89_10115 [Olivibacter sp.]|nr:hypothetical protein [Olivibacter sp. UJ_SKK_5.1]